jgi:hypothetical protein
MIKTYAGEVQLDREVMFLLMQHKGKENAIERWSLVALLYGEEAAAAPIRNNNNEYDRHMRESIERLRGEGKHICNVGGGYYYAATRAEYNEFKRFYLRSVYRQLKITSTMDEAADTRWGKEPQEADPHQALLFGVAQ